MWTTALPLILSQAVLCAALAWARSPGLVFVLLGLAFGSYVWAARRWEGTAGPLLILGLALLTRLVMLPLPPTALSDDILRYVWDGRVLAAGENPYALAPESAELANLRDERWRLMPHKEVPTVYPPLALAFFTVAAALPYPMISLKILLVFVELLGCWLLLRLAHRLELPRGRVTWYAWNPLPAIEIAGMGHVDALVMTASVAAVLALVSKRSASAGFAAVAGVLGKLVPLVALPLWTRSSRRPLVFMAAAGALLVAALAPVVLPFGGPPPGLVTYGVDWEFNGPLYEPLWRLFDRLDLVTAIKDQLDAQKIRTGEHDFWNRFYPYVYPQFLAKIVLMAGFLLGAVLPSVVLRQHPTLGSGRLFGGVLLCAATLYPWYLLWILPWAALARHRAWLALSALVQLAYAPQLFGWELFPWVYLAIWGPFFLLLFSSRWTLETHPASTD